MLESLQQTMTKDASKFEEPNFQSFGNSIKNCIVKVVAWTTYAYLHVNKIK